MIGQFHHQIRLAVELVKTVNVNDVGVIERRAGARLAIKRLHDFRVGRHFPLHHFQRHFPLQLRVQRRINRAHAAGGDDGAQFEIAQHDRAA